MELIKMLERLEGILEKEQTKGLEKNNIEYADYVNSLLEQVVNKTLDTKIERL